MDDELKQAWQSQTPPRRIRLDAGLLLNEVRRNERQFAATIFCRDVREVGVALLLVPVWIFLGITTDSLWSWYLAVPALLWIAGFMIVDRVRQRRQQPAPGDTLRRSVEKSLAQVEHQIWLLRNVFWWYLLPPFAAITVFPAHRAWQSRDDGLPALAEFVAVALVFVLVGWLIYWLNQSAVRQELEPRRNELQALLRSLDESGEGASH
jgi:hypothetical protein